MARNIFHSLQQLLLLYFKDKHGMLAIRSLCKHDGESKQIIPGTAILGKIQDACAAKR